MAFDYSRFSNPTPGKPITVAEIGTAHGVGIGFGRGVGGALPLHRDPGAQQGALGEIHVEQAAVSPRLLFLPPLGQPAIALSGISLGLTTFVIFFN